MHRSSPNWVCRWRYIVTICSWLHFGRPAPPRRGSAAGRKFLAPPYYSQRALFASLWALFFICVSIRLFCIICSIRHINLDLDIKLFYSLRLSLIWPAANASKLPPYDAIYMYIQFFLTSGIFLRKEKINFIITSIRSSKSLTKDLMLHSTNETPFTSYTQMVLSMNNIQVCWMTAKSWGGYGITVKLESFLIWKPL